jgi:hypothetical protein
VCAACPWYSHVYCRCRGGRSKVEGHSGACITRAARLGHAVMQWPQKTMPASSRLHAARCFFMARLQPKSLLRQTGQMKHVRQCLSRMCSLTFWERSNSARVGAGEDIGASPEHDWYTLCSSTDSTRLKHASCRSGGRPHWAPGRRCRRTHRQAGPRRARWDWNSVSAGPRCYWKDNART